MNVLLIGATGFIGRHIRAEGERRGHSIAAPRRTAVSALERDALIRAASGQDVLISAFGSHGDRDALLTATENLLAASVATGVRLIAVGGAGSLRTADGVPLVETPDFPEEFRTEARAQAEALERYRTEGTAMWTYVSPSAIVFDGARSGRYRLGGNDLLTDADGASKISVQDFAVAILDEAEHPKHVRERFTVAEIARVESAASYV